MTGSGWLLFLVSFRLDPDLDARSGTPGQMRLGTKNATNRDSSAAKTYLPSSSAVSCFESVGLSPSSLLSTTETSLSLR